MYYDGYNEKMIAVILHVSVYLATTMAMTSVMTPASTPRMFPHTISQFRCFLIIAEINYIKKKYKISCEKDIG